MERGAAGASGVPESSECMRRAGVPGVHERQPCMCMAATSKRSRMHRHLPWHTSQGVVTGAVAQQHNVLMWHEVLTLTWHR